MPTRSSCVTLAGLAARLGIVVVCAALSHGCQRRGGEPAVSSSSAGAHSASNEPSLVVQIADVRAGKSSEIKLEHTRVSTEELARLTGLESLRTLILDAGYVIDEDVESLAGLTHLEHLRLRESPLTDAGLAELTRCGLDSLVILNLPQAQPTAEGIRELGRLPHVRQLRVGGVKFDDAALEELVKWPELTSLHLIAPSLSDKALETIARMPKLSSFYLDDCPLSDSAWEKLFRARPTLHVHIDQFHHDRDPRGEH